MFRKYVSLLLAQFQGFYGDLSPTKRMSLVLSGALVVGALTVISVLVSGRGYSPLFTKVPTDQLPVIVAQLRQMNVPYKVEDAGETITVPPELLHSTQMAIMSESNVSKIGSIGLEIFDKQDFGLTTRAQQVNYQRALQGELMRSINSLEVVRKSKVILALPQKKTFLEEAGQPKASVVLDLYPGKALSKSQIKGITNLVSAAVENLNSENVTIVNSVGKVLSRSSGIGGAMTNEMVELKERIERNLEDRIESILSRVVGTGKVIARVNAELDTKIVNSVEEIVDPDRVAVRSQQTSEERMDGSRTNPTGVPGARANIPGANEGGQVGFNQNTRTEVSTINNEITKTVKNTKATPGGVKRISIAVLVDGEVKFSSNEQGEPIEEWIPRSEVDLSRYESLVKNAIGYNDKRGDTIQIENIKFQAEDFTRAEDIMNNIEMRKLVSYILRWAVVAVSLALFFFLVIRPFMHWITDSFQESVDDMLPKTIEELEELQAVEGSLPGMTGALPTLSDAVDPDKAESELLKERIMKYIDDDSQKAASALGMWLIRKEL
ncbi:MAG: flagellar basal-body MS-ring/collar protein FliF [Bdellovibrionales bacterium]